MSLFTAGLLFSASCVAYLFVMAEMGQMVLSAIRAIQGEGSDHSRRSLVFIYVCTVLVWTLFPIAFMFSYLRPQYLRHNEALYMFANFTAKVLFSSSIMYGNYMTIEQVRVLHQDTVSTGLELCVKHVGVIKHSVETKQGRPVSSLWPPMHAWLHVRLCVAPRVCFAMCAHVCVPMYLNVCVCVPHAWTSLRREK